MQQEGKRRAAQTQPHHGSAVHAHPRDVPGTKTLQEQARGKPSKEGAIALLHRDTHP